MFMPVTTPAASMDAMVLLLLDHVPVPVASFKVVVLPSSQTAKVPVMAAGMGLTVISYVV